MLSCAPVYTIRLISVCTTQGGYYGLKVKVERKGNSLMAETLSLYFLELHADAAGPHKRLQREGINHNYISCAQPNPAGT